MIRDREATIRVGEYSTLAAKDLLKRLEAIACKATYPERRASHEFILQEKGNHVTALDIAKRLLDYNQHAPTIYSPLLVPECFLIDPTEPETKEAMADFQEEANTRRLLSGVQSAHAPGWIR